jgi:anti-sigma factor RsiW
MHAVVLESLEEYLSGTLKPETRRDIEAHLSLCDSCRQEVAGMVEISGLFDSFIPEEAVVPTPGFYARVMQEVGGRKPAPSLAAFFGLDLTYAKRLVFASLLMLAALGSYLVSREAAFPNGSSPDLVMAQQESPLFEAAPAHEAMLATMTAYEP